MEYERIIFLCRLDNKQTSNILLYDIVKKEYIVCSNLMQKGNKVEWDWGHYYTDFNKAILKLYENEIYNIERNVINTMYNTIIPEIDKIDSQVNTSNLYNAEEIAEKEITKMFKKYYEEKNW